MILTIDLEKTLTQFIIIAFSLVFICVTCWVKVKIEGRFRENAKKLKKTKTKVAKVKSQEIHLCKKALLVASNRQQRSIIAASFLQTCEEELEKLQQITDTIKHVQLPTFLKDLQRLNSHNLLPKVDIPVSVPSRNRVEDSEKKLESKGELKPVQLKLLQTRTCKACTGEEQINCDRKKKTRKEWNTTSVNMEIDKPLEQHKNPHCEGCSPIVSTTNAAYHNVYDEKKKSVTYINKDLSVVGKQLNTTMFPTNSFVKTSSLESVFHKGINVSLQTPPYNIKKSKPWSKIKYSLEQEIQNRKLQPKKRTRYNCLKTNFEPEDKKSNVEEGSPANTNLENNNIVCNKNCEYKMVVKELFKSSQNKASTKIVIKNKRINTVHIEEEFSEAIKTLAPKAHCIYLFHDKNSQHLKSYVFKVPIKMNKKNIILKFVICLSVKYKKKNAQSISTRRTRNLHSCMTQMKQKTKAITRNITHTIPVEHNSCTAQLKSHSLYTNSSICSTNLLKNRSINESDEYTPLAHGDNQMSSMDSAFNYMNQLHLGYKRTPSYISEHEIKNIIDKVTLKEHTGLGKHFMDCSETNYDYHSELVNCLAYCGPTLETIQEESDSDLSDGVKEHCSNEVQEVGSQENSETETQLSIDVLNENATEIPDNAKNVLSESTTVSLRGMENGSSLEENFPNIIITICSENTEKVFPLNSGKDTLDSEKGATLGSENELTVDSEKGLTLDSTKVLMLDSKKGSVFDSEKGLIFDFEKKPTLSPRKEFKFDSGTGFTFDSETGLKLNSKKELTLDSEKGSIFDSVNETTLNSGKKFNFNSEKEFTLNSENEFTLNSEKRFVFDSEKGLSLDSVKGLIFDSEKESKFNSGKEFTLNYEKELTLESEKSLICGSEKTQEKQEILNYNFDFKSFDKTMCINTSSYFPDDEINNCMKTMLMSLSKDLVIREKEWNEESTVQGQDSEHTAVYNIDGFSDSDSCKCNETNFLTFTEEITLTSTEIVDGVRNEDMLVDNYSENSEIQLDFQSPSNSTALTESSSFGSDNVENYIWCDTLAQFRCIDNEFFAHSVWLAYSENFH